MTDADLAWETAILPVTGMIRKYGTNPDPLSFIAAHCQELRAVCRAFTDPKKPLDIESLRAVLNKTPDDYNLSWMKKETLKTKGKKIICESCKFEIAVCRIDLKKGQKIYAMDLKFHKDIKALDGEQLFCMNCSKTQTVDWVYRCLTQSEEL